MQEPTWDRLIGQSAGASGAGNASGRWGQPAASAASGYRSRVGVPPQANEEAAGQTPPVQSDGQAEPVKAQGVGSGADAFSHQTPAAPISVSPARPVQRPADEPTAEDDSWLRDDAADQADDETFERVTTLEEEAAQRARRRTRPSKKRERTEPASGGRGLRIAWMAMMVVLLLALLRLNIGAIVEEICYGLERGKQRAQLEHARVQLAQLQDTSTAFRLIAKSIGPCVVHIDTLRVDQTAGRDGDNGWSRRLEASGQGSGMIVESQGYIITNHHVIKDASEIIVRLSDGRTIRGAEVIGADPQTDLAVIKIEASGLQAAPWGSSESLEVGDWVVAVGNPFGLDRSVTAGIVSAKGRRNVVHNMPYQNFLQTDAAVNPGNSGGPLINLQGEVVGINTAIVGASFQGVSFAIPSEIAREVYTRLRSQGQFVRGWLGVALEDITPQRATELGVPRRGVLVTDVVGEPARRAGLNAGDIVLTWNGQEVNTSAELSWKVAATETGTTVAVTLWRDGEELEVTVRVGERRL